MGQFQRFHKNEVTDEALAEFFRRLVACGRERISFYPGPRPGVEGFVDRFREDGWPMWLLTSHEEMAGIIYLSDVQGKSARIHFAFLPFGQSRAECGLNPAVALGRFCVGSLLHDRYCDGVPMLDVLVGVTPVWNKAALKLIGRCGAVMAGEVPGLCFSHDSGANLPGMISYFTRESVPQEWAEY